MMNVVWFGLRMSMRKYPKGILKLELRGNIRAGS